MPLTPTDVFKSYIIKKNFLLSKEKFGHEVTRTQHSPPQSFQERKKKRKERRKFCHITCQGRAR